VTNQIDGTPNAFTDRETWLKAFIEKIRRLFPVEHAVPENIRITCGLPSRRAFAKHQVIGECWSHTMSRDGFFEIMISPVIDDPMRVSGITAHELTHATVGLKYGHRGPFAKVARALGLEGPLTATTEGEAFKRKIAPILDALGPYPHAALLNPRSGGPSRGDPGDIPSSGAPKQGTRLLKCHCTNCGYVVRVTRKWIDDVGRPHCPHHGEMALAL